MPTRYMDVPNLHFAQMYSVYFVCLSSKLLMLNDNYLLSTNLISLQSNNIIGMHILREIVLISSS